RLLEAERPSRSRRRFIGIALALIGYAASPWRRFSSSFVGQTQRERPSKPSRTRPDGSGYMRRYSSGSLTTGGSSSRFSFSSSSSSSSSSSLGSRGGGELLTRVLLTNQVETFSGLRGVMSAPVWMLRRSRGY